MRRPATFVLLAAALFAAVPASHADYAVMRSGVRLHITGYQQMGDRMRLTVAGGTVEVAANDVAAIEPEETFLPNPPAAPAVNGPFAELIRNAAAKHGVDQLLVQRVIAQESNFNPRAVSHKEALGLMQLLPKTAAKYSVVNIFDPAQNIDAGTHYLKDLLEQYRGNLALALAAYNAGPEMVERYRGIPPFPETQEYVRRITADLAKAKMRSSSGASKHVAPGTEKGKDSRPLTGPSVDATAAAEAGRAAAAGASAAPGWD